MNLVERLQQESAVKIFAAIGYIAVLLLLVFATIKVFSLLKRAPDRSELAELAVPVTVKELRRGNFPASFSAFGTVRAEQDLELIPLVSGAVVKLHPNFEVGGIIEKDELLFQIDPRDFEIQLQVSRASLARAEFELKLEEGNQIVAKREWELLSDSVERTSVGETLALRKPQLAEKQAALSAAQNQVQLAELNLERASIRAPYRALVVEENVAIGKYVSPGLVTARLAGVDIFQIEARLPQKDALKLSKINAQQKREVEVFSGESANSRLAKLVRVSTAVDQSGRMSTALIKIDDPLNLSETAASVPIFLNSYARVRLQGPEEKDVYSIPAEGLRENEYVFLVDAQSRLKRQKVTIVHRGENNILVRSKELAKNIRLIISPMQVALSGMLLEAEEIDAQEAGSAD